MTEEGGVSKLATVRENLEKLECIPHASYADFCSDFRNLDSALHRLQTTIQALIGVACYLVACRGLGVPATSLDALEKLEAAGLLLPGSGERFSPVIGFRNHIVHLYDRIDPEIVYRVVTERRGDLIELARLLVSALEG